MDNSEGKVVRMKDRKYYSVPIDRITILNPRSRDQEKFKENIRSIKVMGQYKPIIINKRNFEKKGCYELICGQGRMEAQQELGETMITAEIVDVSDETAYIMSLQENLTRMPPATIEFARSLLEMKQRGATYDELCKITGRSRALMQRYIQLMEHGEERLIVGVDQGDFPITFALDVAQSKDGNIQNVLMDAYDKGIIANKNLYRVRRILENRKKRAERDRRVRFKGTLEELENEIHKITKEKNIYVDQAEQKETRLTQISLALEKMAKDEKFNELLKTTGLIDEKPQLKGNYT